MDNLETYCRIWGLRVNTNKTKIIVFRKGGNLKTNDRWTYCGRHLEIVSSFKYLGCVLSITGSFSKNIEEVATSSRRAIFGLRKCFIKNTEIIPSMQIELFKKMVSPILSYGGEVWGLNVAAQLEIIHLSFLKSILGVKSSTPNCFIYGELGVYPLYVERQIMVIKYWLKIMSLKMENEGDNYLVKVYDALYNLNLVNPDVVTWCTQVRNLLFKVGFGYVWLNQSVSSHAAFLSAFKERIQDIYVQEWTANLRETSSNRLLKTIKSKFIYEPYLDILDRHLRIALSKIRLSSHLFMIERGRWGKKRLKLEARTCTTCNVLEDEYHCLAVCPRFNNERSNYLPSTLKKQPNMYEFIKFLKKDDAESIKKLAILCIRVQKQYEEYI